MAKKHTKKTQHGTKVGTEKITKKKDHVYFVGGDGYVREAPMNRKGRKKGT